MAGIIGYNMNETIIEVKNLFYKYPDGKQALKNISFEIKEGQKVALLGANGSGKTTLLFCLVGLLDYQGEIKIFGQDLKQNAKEIRKKIGFVFENPDDQLFNLTVYDDIAFSFRQQGYKEEQIKQKVKNVLEKLNLLGYEGRQPYHLSYGEKKKVCLATALVNTPQILILDEPTSNLDPASRREFKELIKNIQTTQIIATHDLQLAKEVCDSIIILNNGEVFCQDDISLVDNTEILLSARLM